MPSLAVRAAVAGDLPGILAIYNHYVRETPITFDIAPFTEEERLPWMDQFGESGPYRLLVAVENSRVLGYASSTRFRPKPAYNPTVETTVYVDPDDQRRGIGRKLYESLFAELASEDVHCAIAGITLPNDPSIAFHRSFGFEPCGVFREVGFKFEQRWDVAFYQKFLA